MDRMSDFESESCGFESYWARHVAKVHVSYLWYVFFYFLIIKDYIYQEKPPHKLY